jgi:hypothetical protein
MTDTSLPDEFRHSALIERIVRGAIEDDPVRLHGAIFAALEIHGRASAQQDVFAAALQTVGENCEDCRPVAAAAIRDHLAHAEWATS